MTVAAVWTVNTLKCCRVHWVNGSVSPVKLTVQANGLLIACSVQLACAGANDCPSGGLLSTVLYCADHCLSCVYNQETCDTLKKLLQTYVKASYCVYCEWGFLPHQMSRAIHMLV